MTRRKRRRAILWMPDLAMFHKLSTDATQNYEFHHLELALLQMMFFDSCMANCIVHSHHSRCVLLFVLYFVYTVHMGQHRASVSR